MSIIRDPFSTNIDSVPSDIQLELIDSQCDASMQDLFRNKTDDITNFNRHLNKEKYVNLRSLAKKILVIFGSTYICEQTFFIMNHNKSPNRSRISDEHLHAILRISTSTFDPDIETLTNKCKQLHLSH